MTESPRCCDRPMARGGLVRRYDRGRVWFERCWWCERCRRVRRVEEE